MSNRSRGIMGRSGSVAPLAGIAGFVFGVLLVFVFFVLPQQRIIMAKDALVTGMVEFNQKEQERLAQMRDVSEAQLRKWVSINEDASRKYQEILSTLQKQEKLYSNPGLYWTTLMLVFLCVLIAYYIWANRLENLKDVATLENFEIFIEQRLMNGRNGQRLPNKAAEGRHLDQSAEAP